MLILARNEEINRWLSENPAVLGGIALLLGLVLLGWGISDFVTGKAHGKWGTEMSGGTAKLMGIIRIVAGVAVSGFGVFKLVQAVL